MKYIFLISKTPSSQTHPALASNDSRSRQPEEQRDSLQRNINNETPAAGKQQ